MIATTNAIDFAKFEAIVKLLNQAQRIQIVGIDGSALTAKDFTFKLLKIGVTALNEQDTYVQVATANTPTKDDILIAISFSGTRREILVAAQSAYDKGATIIALTNIKKSPLRKLAHYTIDTIADEKQFRSSSISSRTAQNVITDLLFMTLLQLKSDKAKLLLNEISSAVERI